MSKDTWHTWLGCYSKHHCLNSLLCNMHTRNRSIIQVRLQEIPFFLCKLSLVCYRFIINLHCIRFSLSDMWSKRVRKLFPNTNIYINSTQNFAFCTPVTYNQIPGSCKNGIIFSWHQPNQTWNIYGTLAGKLHSLLFRLVVMILFLEI